MTQQGRIVSFKCWMLVCVSCVLLFVLYVEMVWFRKSPDKCTEVATSEGVRTLHHGQKACSPLRGGETDEDMGRRYVLCRDGVVSEKLCHPFRRYDTVKGKCNWPHLATCQLKEITSRSFSNESSLLSSTSARATFVTPPTIQHHHPQDQLQKPSTNNEISPTSNHTLSINNNIQPFTRQLSPDAHHISSATRRTPSTTPQVLPNTSQVPPPTHQVPPTTSHMPPTTRQIPTTPSQMRPMTYTQTINYTKSPLSFKKSIAKHNKACSDKNCRLPDCFCYGGLPNFSIPDTPQFIMVTFDDSVTPQIYEAYYQNLFVDNKYQIFNPSGCPLRGTFFVSIERSDLHKVMNLWYAGNEIGSHTIHHLLPKGDNESDYHQAAQEIDGMRQEVFKVLNNQAFVDSIKGFRAPFLKVARNIQFDVLYDFNFLYDTSFTSTQIRKGQRPIWPFTLDHILIGKCINYPCPTKVYPGLWEVIMNAWIRDDGNSCSMVDSCISPSRAMSANQTDWENLFHQHFEYFYKYKVPMSFFTHASIFGTSPTSYPALVYWLQRVTSEHPDVWVVTLQQVLQWMKNPMTNQQMAMQQWGC